MIRAYEREFRSPKPVDRETVDALLRFGGFPEPFLSGSERFSNRWRNARHALQVAVGAEPAGVDPFAYEGRPVVVSAADFLSVLI